ncbi:MAG: VWA domain-containing protein [Candidatus Margulisiibacteriota bacterium]|nr:VWA domain-containing protein [Candidatus Margulisiibacteriota bacterium]
MKKIAGLLGVLMLVGLLYGCSTTQSASNPNDTDVPCSIPSDTNLTVSASNITVGSDSKSLTFNMAAIDQNNAAFTDLTKGNLQVSVASTPETWTITYIANGANTGTRNFSMAMTLDRSGSMSSADNSSLEAAALSLVGLIPQGDADVGVINFASTVTVDATMTTDKSLQSVAITDESYVGGSTALYDSMGAAIDLVLTGANGYKVVIAMTDGGENYSSTYTTTTEIIDYSVQSGNVPIFALGYGLSASSAAEVAMQNIATGTGGLYYSAPSPEALVEVYDTLASTMANAYQVSISGNTALPAGTHTLTIVVKDENGNVVYTVSVPFVVS